MSSPDHSGDDPGSSTALDDAVAQRRAAVLIEEALGKADGEGIRNHQTLTALTDTASALAWKLGGEPLLRKIITRIEAAIDVLNGKRLPPQSDARN